MNRPEKLINLMKENPDLPVIPMVDAEVVGDDYGYWLGAWGYCEIKEYYNGRDRIHFKTDEDEETVLSDMVGCEYCLTKDGRDIYDLSDDEWKTLYESLPWEKAIVVGITV